LGAAEPAVSSGAEVSAFVAFLRFVLFGALSGTPAVVVELVAAGAALSVFSDFLCLDLLLSPVVVSLLLADSPVEVSELVDFLRE